MSSGLDVVRILRAARFSFVGLRTAFQHHTVFRQEMVLGVILAPAAVLPEPDSRERAVLLGSLMLVPIVELLNSAVETVMDLIDTERNDLSGRAKDLGSAAVFVSLIDVSVA